jgi:Fe-S cluster assembly iron-binding protein IscA
MNIQLTPLAAVKLKLLLLQERENQNLAVHVVPLTTGCGSPSFALEITEASSQFQKVEILGVPFAWQTGEEAWLDGLVIDLNRETGRFVIYHPNPPFSTCPFDHDD